MKTKLIVILVLIYVSSFGQDRKEYFPVWTYHSKNSDIYGVSLGVLPKGILKDLTLTRTYGIRAEAPGLGLLYFMAPRSYITGGVEEKYIIEEVYGINLSGGGLRYIKVDGFSGAVGGQYLQKMNGIAVAFMGNSIEEHSGISIAFMQNEMHAGIGLSVALGNMANHYKGIQIGAINEITKMGVGMQIGLFNKSNDQRGIQLGLWNRNSKRSLPFINWQFKS
ncbi:hypothetical protein [Aquimarina sp. MMG016]|uniref:LA_2272 family surface repeat-containing protein n=1 Tax=Aquimarina sp. MMG016 TaxID=2822690 RepID=UPI001B3A2C87|nr:hypothetical protein [Aquimarina sp. MMG016]MBQ4822328.1 hypothetical protein [Aquimarina sp. MMG016]